MRKHALSKRDVILLSTMLVLAIVFVVLGLLAPRQTPRPNAVEVKSPQVASDPSLRSWAVPSSSSRLARTAPTEAERAQASEPAITESDSSLQQQEVQPHENAPEETVPVQDDEDWSHLSPDEYHRWAMKRYPRGDVQRLTPEERVHRELLLEQMRELGAWRKTWRQRPIPMEEYIMLDEEDTSRTRWVGGQLAYYDSILYGDDPVVGRDRLQINPHTEGDLAGEE